MFFSRRYLISLFYLMVITVGIAAWMNIPMELSPDAQLPSITVSHRWGSVSPEVVEQEVTRRVEQAATRLRDVEGISSVTREGFSSVTIRFRKNAPVDFRAVELQETMYALRESLPPGLIQNPISRAVPRELAGMQTFMVYTLNAELPPRALLELAEQRIRLPLMGLAGLSEIAITGVRQPALAIVFDTRTLDRYGLNPGSLLQQVRQQLQWQSAGFTEEPAGRLSILIPPRFSNTEEIGAMQLSLPGSDRLIRLSDLARVELRDYPERERRRINGNPSLTISFEKEPGADALSLASEIRNRIEAISETLPVGVDLRLQQDNTERLRRQLSELQTQSFYSLVAVFVVLLVFIRRFRAPFIIVGSIIFSLMIAVILLLLTGYTINVITLAGLTVAIGMIIDNAVVVFEIVNPGLPTGRASRIQHIRKNLTRALVPVFGSTLTTVGIFIPLLFALEANRLMLVPLATALTYALGASVLVSLSWIPYALIWLLPSGIRERVSFRQLRAGGLFKRVNLLRLFWWRRRLRWVLVVVLIAAIGIPTFSIDEPRWEGDCWIRSLTAPYFENKRDVDRWVGGITYRFFNNTFFGEPWGRLQGEQVFISINPPQGTPLEELDKIALNFELIAQPYRHVFEYFETIVSEHNGARLIFHIKPEWMLDADPYRFYAEAAYLAARTGNSRISVSGLGDPFFSGGGATSSATIVLQGYSYNELEQTAQELGRRLERNRRVQNVDVNQTGFWGRNDLEQYVMRLDDRALAARGLDRTSVLDMIQVDVNPENIFGRVEFQGQQLYLMGISQGQDRYWMDFKDRPRLQSGGSFTIGEIANLQRLPVLNDIRRENQAYSRGIAYDFLGPSEMSRNFRERILEEFPFPIGVTVREQGFWDFGGAENRRNMLFIALMALVSVWMIVSALLEKWRDPLAVILSVPFALLGVMSGVLYHELNFTQGAIAGTLLSVGVVVNNAILLIHEKERLRRAGIWGLRSWVYVYRSRFRAVMITSATTIAGLVPMIIFGSDPVWTHLAIVVSWGLGFSTVLLLLFTGIFGR
jgi:hydrophobic/amphiphilic exporter-1 (mainly G- bacteria), HAE1 family